MEALERAKTDREALVAALDAWRKARDPLLASIIEHLGRRVKNGPIDKANLHETWLARAASAQPEDVEPLLESIGRQLDERRDRWPVRPTDFWFARLDERVRALAVFPDDPRIARGLTEIVRRGPWTPGWGGDFSSIYGPILALVVRIDDLRTVEVLSQLRDRPVHRIAGFRDYLETALPEALSKMTPARSVDGAVHARIEALATKYGVVANEEPRMEASAANGDELLAAIYADPDDDGAREVYADWLLEEKDPRGELIALQFAELRGTASAKDEKRIASLVRAHQADWLGELALVTKNRVFRRGMLEEAELHSGGVATDELWERVLVDERLSTVRVLDKGKANEALFIRFLASPARRSLRRVIATTSNTVEALVQANSPFRIETVKLDRPSRDSMKLLASATTLPALHTLEVAVGQGRIDAVAQSIAQSKIASRVQSVVVDLSWGSDASGVGAAITKLESLGLREVRVVRYGLEISAGWDGDARVIDIAVLRNSYGLLEAVQTLPHCARISLTAKQEPPDAQHLFERAHELRSALQARARDIQVDDVLSPLFGLPRGSS